MQSVKVLNKRSQIRMISSELKYRILQELIKGAATCQQLADSFNVSRQKTHYSLTHLIEESLIEVAHDCVTNSKEVFYRATARNYVLDLAIGTHVPDKIVFSREMINSILRNDFGIDLQRIAAKLVDESLKLKPKEKLLIVTGQNNMPLAEKIVLEASIRSVNTTLHYEGMDIQQAILDKFSLSALKVYWDNRLKLFQASDAVLVLNREKDTLGQPQDPKKRRLMIKHQMDINNLLLAKNKKDFRIGAMIGYLLDDLSESNIASEIRFWRSLDTDYEQLQRETKELSNQFSKNAHYLVKKGSTEFKFTAEKVICEYGSYVNDPQRSSVINLPGGEVLVVPKENSINGKIIDVTGFFNGQKVENIKLEIKDNQIVNYSAETNSSLLAKAIEEGGPDGRKIAMVCFGTNSSVSISDNNPHYRHKRQGVMSIYWGDNTIFGGEVKGHNYWMLEIENPILSAGRMS